MSRNHSYMAGLSIGASILAGCATTGTEYVPSKEEAPSRIGYAMDVLGVNDQRMLQMNLPGGYIASKTENGIIRSIVGLWKGTARVRGGTDDFVATTPYNQLQDPDAIQVVCEVADTNKDRVATHKELWDLASRLVEGR